jgi:hypothetical protein
MLDNETAVLPCGHALHQECLVELRSHGANGNCPECREVLPPSPQDFFDEGKKHLDRGAAIKRSGGNCEGEMKKAAVLFHAVKKEVTMEVGISEESDFLLEVCHRLVGSGPPISVPGLKICGTCRERCFHLVGNIKLSRCTGCKTQETNPLYCSKGITAYLR